MGDGFRLAAAAFGLAVLAGAGAASAQQLVWRSTSQLDAEAGFRALRLELARRYPERLLRMLDDLPHRPPCRPDQPGFVLEIVWADSDAMDVRPWTALEGARDAELLRRGVVLKFRTVYRGDGCGPQSVAAGAWSGGSLAAAAPAPPQTTAAAFETASPAAVAPRPRAEAPKAAEEAGLSPLEAAVLAEINAARADPAAYGQALRRFRAYYDGGVVKQPGDPIGVMTNEGVAAIDEAIAFLEQQKPLPPLELHPGLARSAAAHVADQGPGGRVGHLGSDGSTASQRMRAKGVWAGYSAENISFGFDQAEAVVRQLIIDDGVAGRGHRKAIFDAGLSKAGVGCGPHRLYNYMCVIDFAGAVVVREAADGPAPMQTTRLAQSAR
jgi:uncharacterized protein YkwD